MHLILMVALEPPGVRPVSLTNGTAPTRHFSEINQVEAPGGLTNHPASLVAQFNSGDKIDLSELAKWGPLRDGDTSITAGWADEAEVYIRIVSAPNTAAAINTLNSILRATPALVK